MRLRRIAQLMVMGLVAAAVPIAAEIHVVDCVAGPFVDIASAVDAAGPGDSVLVRRCPEGPYAPFAVVGKERVHILAAQSTAEAALPSASFHPPVRIDGGGGFPCILIDASADIALQGFGIRNCGFHAIEVRNSTGTRIIRNRIDGGLESIRDQSSTHSSYLGNLLVGATFSIFLDSDDALVASNLILRDGLNGIFVLGSGHQVVGNEVRLGGAAGITDQGVESRIERNRCLDNGGDAQIRINDGSLNADVVSNVTGDSIQDLGTGTELADNR